MKTRKLNWLPVLFAALVMAAGMTACEEEITNTIGREGGGNRGNTGGGSSSEFAPEDLSQGTKILWDGYYLLPGDDTHYAEDNCQLTILNETDCRSNWSTDWGTYRYSKTGENTAKLSFSIVQNVLGHVRSFQYTTELNFTSKNRFEMTGTKNVLSNMVANSICELHCSGTIE